MSENESMKLLKLDRDIIDSAEIFEGGEWILFKEKGNRFDWHIGRIYIDRGNEEIIIAINEVEEETGLALELTYFDEIEHNFYYIPHPVEGMSDLIQKLEIYKNM